MDALSPSQNTPDASPNAEDPSHDSNAPATSRKRRRLPVSCFACRKRKMRCDRALPCDRCVKGGIGHQCTYAGEPGEGSPSTKSQRTSREVMAKYTRTLALCNNESPHDAATRSSSFPLSTAPQSVSASGQAFLVDDHTSVRHLQDRIHSLENLVTELSRKPQNGSAGWSTGIPTMSHAGPSPSSDIDHTRRNSNHHNGPPVASLDRTRDQEFDIDHHAANHHYQKVGPQFGGSPGMGMMRGKNGKTRHYGQSHCSSIIRVFEEDMATFLREAKTLNPELYNMRHGFDRFKDKPNRLSYIGRELADLIPSKAQADELIRRYIKVYESTYRILHTPTFLDRYQAFWDRRQSSPDFVALLLAIMSTVLCIRESNDLPNFVGTSSPDRETAVIWINALQTWLADPAHTTKDYQNLTILRIHALLIISHRANHIRVSGLSTQSGTLVKMAMSMGLHVDPDNFKRMNAFHCEMRRRLWTTILELDLQAAVERGTIPTICAEDYSCKPPSNLDDVDIRENQESLRPGRPLEIITESSFQILLHQSLQLRLRVARLVNSVHLEPSYDEILKLDTELLQFLQDIPPILKPQTDPKAGYDLSCLPKILLDVQIRWYLLVLHLPFIARCKENPQYNYSRHSCLHNASIIVSYRPQYTAGGINLASFLYKDSLFLAALALCLLLFTSVPLAVGPQSPYHQSMHDSIIVMIKDAIKTCEIRGFLSGKGLKEYCFLIMLLCIVRTKEEPEKKEFFIREASDQVASKWRSMIGNDERDLGLNTPAASTGATESGDVPPVLPPILQQQPTPQQHQGIDANGVDAMTGFDGFDPVMQGDFSGFANLWGGIDDEVWSFN